MPGAFIVLDGPDGSGTSTHAKMLSKKLQKKGKKVILTAEPTDGRIGKLVRTILKSGEPINHRVIQMLFCADRFEHLSLVIEPALKAGRIVICDRYVLSTLAYGLAGGLDINWLRIITTEFKRPDLTVALLPPFPTSFGRLEERKHKDAFEQRAFQREVRRHYQELANQDISILKIDTDSNVQEVSEQILLAVLERLP
jgi:dTMP kinase